MSINDRAAALVDALVQDAAALRLRVEKLDDGVTVIDAGIQARGGMEAGRRIAEICLGGLGCVTLKLATQNWPLSVSVTTAQPVLACLGSQYAGWSLAAGEGKDKFFALGSGPARALAGKEPLFGQLGYRDRAARGVLVMEVERTPPREVIDKVLRDCSLTSTGLSLILTPTISLAGNTQVVARVLEVALHKAHTLHFPLDRIVDGAGCAPLPAPGADFMSGMARTNDAILYGGMVQLLVDDDDDAARQLAQQLPSANSRDHGRSFGDIFKSCDYDFYRVDPLLFAPAQVVVSSLRSGNSHGAGKVDVDLLMSWWKR